ncbi:acyl-CoA dehydrogenase/oxidase [Clohesyomyces aquaticus]|uniref:Acyl-CoA dehydrogenase/oxidase n=1 Tax=Clohesyomyces aquaticus TaxID=1231657 RepID=A0A1Y1Y0Y2_9PLEO|nr:acyl-CoA dehydrogenase/oxidase [Clohesyomyces aquaticus]
MLDGLAPVQPQYRIFLNNLERQMSDEQKAYWVPKAKRFEIFGSYSQTKLGHGSNVRGIETTATFDKSTDEFVISSPMLSSTKYVLDWGDRGLGHAFDCGGQAYYRWRNYGNHIFLAQLRDLETQRLMEGVEIYEMGLKGFQGMVGVDNGALRFHDVRIPRE